MSKINQLQAAALSAPVNKIEPVKAPVKKPVTTKSVVSNPAAAQSAAVKPASAKPVAVVSKAKVTKPVKEKVPKLKMERDSFTMPKAEYAQFYVLKERLTKLGQPAKKSELLRAGIMLLTAMTDAALKAAMSKVPTIKTGRPKNK
ncbi:hypothetical protein [Methylotenera sp.]|uniref:hypothetical protein n=1 Tax=Methylotenera sp. TaxID=2051956 RepID=UPI0027173E65|nr:hypothetical protein [Methylotenera sp.]MDO9205959.1 hypothetical protein [Methylotenera sp.]MDP3308501.1 hypothetical protein [Methylotenera sp.]MDP3817777.1 hypothetical protein [Methylotenera sp.]